uniref:Uncharacterized protein n=1 Tax=Glossina austeni TaxID=7395 RepID=A0A1A9VST8_GLOAU
MFRAIITCKTVKYSSAQWLEKCSFSTILRNLEKKQPSAVGEIYGESMLQFCPPRYWPLVPNVFPGSDKSQTANNHLLDCFLNCGTPYLSKDVSEDNCQQREQFICCPFNTSKWRPKKSTRISDSCYLESNDKFLWCRNFIKSTTDNMCQKEVCPKPITMEQQAVVRSAIKD